MGYRDGFCQLVLMPSGRRGEVPRGANLLKAAAELGVELESICGGRQTCGKCQVIVEEGRFPKHGITSRADHLSPPTEVETCYVREHRIGDRRLACAAEIIGDLLVSVPEESQARKQVIAKAASERVIEVDPAVRQVYVEVAPARLGDPRGDWERLVDALEAQWGLTALDIDAKTLPTLQDALREGYHAVTVTLWQNREVLRVQPGYKEGVYGLAVDVGSTTIAAHLCDLRTGAVLSTQAAMNPQVRYGEDLMSRVSYATTEAQGLARLNRAVIRTLNELAETAAGEAGLLSEDILDMVVVGNTVMHHIFLGIHPVELGGAPFALAVDSALDLKARDLGLNLHPAARVHTLPLIAGHVGADNVAVLLAEAPYEQDEIMLVVDVGTNAEILLGDRNQVLVASSPTGPAFEGAQIVHGQRAAPGAVERVRIDPVTLEPRIRLIGSENWLEPGDRSSPPFSPPFSRGAGGDSSPPFSPPFSRGAGGDSSPPFSPPFSRGAGGDSSPPSSPPFSKGAGGDSSPPSSPPFSRGAGGDSSPPSSPPFSRGAGGDKATGICGSGIIEAVAELFLAGIIDAGGLFQREAAQRSWRVRFRGRKGEYVLVDEHRTATGSPIVITQDDVRAIQLAKAALYAGAKLLMAHRGVDHVDRVVLAGAFGSFISPFHALVLGLIPDCELENVTAVGNAAGDGARLALLNRQLRLKAAELAHWVDYVETPLEASFQDEFVAAMGLPHASDPFPTLRDYLPELAARTRPRPRSRASHRKHTRSEKVE